MASASPAATVPEPRAESLRIYCSTHNLGFAAPRAASIKCESGGHELDHGFPYTAVWEYCCDCQHYWLLDAGKAVAEQECPVCERKITKRFFCADCKVLTTESNNPGRRKAYSISSAGVVTPTCPGCQIVARAGAVDHECAEFGETFVTSRASCLFCDAVLEAPPSFPCSVSSYLEKLRLPSVKLEFDPAANLLRESKTGEYILIEKVRGSALPIVLPGAAKLDSKQEYYETYYELFNCDNPAAGEVIVLSPAVVDKVTDGWQLREPGFIDIKSDGPPLAAVSPTKVQIPCPACGVPGDIGHAFCKSCGAPVLGQQTHVATSAETAPFGQNFSTTETSAYSLPDDSARDSVSATAPVAAAGVPWKLIMGIVAGVALLASFIALAGLSSNGSLSSSGPSVETRLQRAIAAGSLFSPAGENAHDLYYELKNSGASEEKLSGYREKLTALLTPNPYALLSNLMQIGYDEPESPEWLDAARNLEWAQELNPNNNSIAARAAYCRGRAAYLQKDLDGALKWWTRSATLDKAWVLPVNGLGMIHTANDNFSTARTYFQQALDRDASWPFPEENIGNTYWEEKNYDSAKEYYRKAIGKAPKWSKPHIHLAYIALTEKDYATAVSEFEAALAPDAIGLKGKEPAAAQKALEKARQKLSEERGY